MNKETRPECLVDFYLKSDADFNLLYPPRIQQLAKRHWTPLHITHLVTNFFGNTEVKILDIGSGAGKFCLAAACYSPNTQFYGIEQRAYLIQHAKDAQIALDISNVTFIHGSFTDLDFRAFDGFYFFNSFYENLNNEDRIDEEIEYSESLYRYYTSYLYRVLEQMPKGTKVVTYHCYFREVPDSYKLVESHQDGDLNFWVRR